MADIVLGVIAILAGLVFCFGGRLLLRLVFPIWGFFAGFAFGAGLVAGFSEEHFLGTAIGWVLGLIFALLFAALAYFFYAVGVVIAMASIGFAIGSGLVVALGIDWNWVAVLVGVLAGAALGIGAVIANVPMLVLTVLSSVGGAIVATSGFMLLTGAMDSADFTRSSATDQIKDDWWWYAVFFVLAIAGLVVQTRDAAAMRRSMRASWAEPTP
jgi:hypothetical protein